VSATHGWPKHSTLSLHSPAFGAQPSPLLELLLPAPLPLLPEPLPLLVVPELLALVADAPEPLAEPEPPPVPGSITAVPPQAANAPTPSTAMASPRMARM
jgi:hypothetical protein